MDFDKLPPQLRMVLHSLAKAVSSREPAIRARVHLLQEANAHLTSDQLARRLIRSTRRRVATTGAISGAVSIAPGLGTMLAVGTLTSQALYALEQEIELVLAIAIIYGHELGSSDERVLEALVVVGITSGAVKLREDVLVAGGERVAIAAVRRLPTVLVTHGGGRILSRILGRFASTGAAKVAARVVPLGVGVAAGAGFDWLAVTKTRFETDLARHTVVGLDTAVLIYHLDDTNYTNGNQHERIAHRQISITQCDHAGHQRRCQAGGRAADRDVGSTEEGEDKSGDDRRNQTADRRRAGGHRNPERERDPHHGDLQPCHQVVTPMLQPSHPVLGFLDCWNIYFESCRSMR